MAAGTGGGLWSGVQRGSPGAGPAGQGGCGWVAFLIHSRATVGGTGEPGVGESLARGEGKIQAVRLQGCCPGTQPSSPQLSLSQHRKIPGEEGQWLLVKVQSCSLC